MMKLANKKWVSASAIRLGLMALVLLAVGCDDVTNDYENSAGQADKIPGGPSEPDNPAKDNKTGDEKDNPPKSRSVEEQLAQIDFSAAPTLGEVARQYYRIILEEDWAAKWEMLSKKSQAVYENRDLWVALGLDPDEVPFISTPRECYVLLMQKQADDFGKIDRLDPITGEEIAPDKKSGWLVNKGGQTYKFVKEDGQWKLALPD